ncbi:MAG: hypothetical protein M5R36_20465 [Deltaproteobacteria bacterium]|nr:hypothetical protein [Deltaproteobacteria bacterium]
MYYQRQGDWAMEKKDFADAVKNYRKAMEIQPDDMQLRRNYNWALNQKKKHDR